MATITFHNGSGDAADIRVLFGLTGQTEAAVTVQQTPDSLLANDGAGHMFALALAGDGGLGSGWDADLAQALIQTQGPRGELHAAFTADLFGPIAARSLLDGGLDSYWAENAITYDDTGGANHMLGGGQGDLFMIRGGGDTALGQGGDDVFLLFTLTKDEFAVADLASTLAGGAGKDQISVRSDQYGAGVVDVGHWTIRSVEALDFEAGATLALQAGQFGAGGISRSASVTGYETRLQISMAEGGTLSLAQLSYDTPGLHRITVTGSQVADRITGHADSDDLLAGQGGNDRLRGLAGDDSLRGGAGDDWLAGGAGVDTLRGGAGDDTLWGGAGADQFAFVPGAGADVIRDFAVGEDRIDLTAFGGLTSFALLADALVSLRPRVSQLVLAEDLRLTIHHASEQPLTADDFLF